MHKKGPIGLCLFLVFFFSVSNILFAKTDIEFILDASGSMRAKMGGATQMDVAKQAIKTSLESLPPDAFVALRVYAHRVEQTNKKGSCVDSELLIPFGPLNKSDFATKVDSIQPKGYTPIAYSLEQAAGDFGTERESDHVLVLVSDGEETCGGDPVATVKKLSALGFKVKVHAVGFNVDPKAQAQLMEIAKAGGGQYYDARDPASLSGSLKKITEETFLVQKTSAVYGEEIKGGDSYETAVPLPAGKLFRLNHHQRKNEYDYFSVDMKSGQKIVASVETGQNGVQINGKEVSETQQPFAGIALHNNRREQIVRDDVYGGQNSKKTISYIVANGLEGRYYVLIGSVYGDQHKDNRFQIDVINQFDANGDRDAGADDASALEIAARDFEKNYLGEPDKMDVFKFNAAPGIYQINARAVTFNPADTFPGQLLIEAYDSDGTKLRDATSPNPGAVANIENLNITKSGSVFLKISDSWGQTKGRTEELIYSLSIASGAAVAQTPSAQPGPTNQQAVQAPTETPSPASPTSIGMGDTFRKLSFAQKVKWILLCFLIPWVFTFSIGALFGYLLGRSTAKGKSPG